MIVSEPTVSTVARCLCQGKINRSTTEFMSPTRRNPCALSCIGTGTKNKVAALLDDLRTSAGMRECPDYRTTRPRWVR